MEGGVMFEVTVGRFKAFEEAAMEWYCEGQWKSKHSAISHLHQADSSISLTNAIAIIVAMEASRIGVREGSNRYLVYEVDGVRMGGASIYNALSISVEEADKLIETVQKLYKVYKETWRLK